MYPARFPKARLASGSKLSGEPRPSALYLTEIWSEINEGASFLDQLTEDEIRAVRLASTSLTVEPNETIFLQGDPHRGIYLIEAGRVRTYYVGPSGREVTLAYWTEGHFIGGPEVFGGGKHMWSAMAVQSTRLTFLSAIVLRHLVKTIPSFAICIIEAMAAKGKCYSALVQMLGTRSVIERLAQLLLILAELHGRREGSIIVIDREITHEQIATIVGSTRQWVTSTLKRFEEQGIVSVTRNAIRLKKPQALCDLP